MPASRLALLLLQVGKMTNFLVCSDIYLRRSQVRVRCSRLFTPIFRDFLLLFFHVHHTSLAQLKPNSLYRYQHQHFGDGIAVGSESRLRIRNGDDCFRYPCCDFPQCWLTPKKDGLPMALDTTSQQLVHCLSSFCVG